MKGLLLRLSALDADAAAALRVIAHFEALLGAGRLDAASLVRSTAGLAECPAGLEVGGRVVRFGPAGTVPAESVGTVSGSAEFAPGGRVWLERTGAPGPFDELVLEWMAIAAGVVHGGREQDSPPHQVADPALVERVLSEREAVEDRARALRLLGLAPERPLRVVAVAGASSVAVLGRRELRPGVRVAAVGPLAVALVPGAASVAEELRAFVREQGSEGVRIGVGGRVPALDAGASWAQARLALRFAVDVAGLPDEAVVDHDTLGPVALLADIPVDRLRAQADVRALAGLAEGRGGPAALAALTAFLRTGSLRHAAADLHLHHSSVAARMSGVESELGYRLSNPQDRFRAQLALYALRLAQQED
ncbi:helix-turn-helix domain-containing protein [Streptomyces sp. Qhu-G9]|uniref:PucR family transcriptional regulator n=1 Tax=Streptomyces sp. Qhu-G9 TaxID=3452799 RepID=UPI0022ABD4EF|nr:helix-turn-helix domain-containing protein [Streptomyces aurantiacus]WAU79434.1 helix-turn-helix domain-containing protein [Streptomyces aurantiacus]